MTGTDYAMLVLLTLWTALVLWRKTTRQRWVAVPIITFGWSMGLAVVCAEPSRVHQTPWIVTGVVAMVLALAMTPFLLRAISRLSRTPRPPAETRLRGGLPYTELDQDAADSS